MATYGRDFEIDKAFESFCTQDIGSSNFEIILVDQNTKIDLSPIVAKYADSLRIIHIRSSKKGLSHNRNIGLLRAQGDYVCFPDDDCTYYPDTLNRALYHLKSSNSNAVFGAIRDRTNGENIIRNWPSKNRRLTRYNFFSLYSSITVFCKKNELTFNENLGAGCYFGACEDSEYTYNLIKNLGRCYYFTDIEVWHPKVGLEQFTKEKNISYGLGFGAFSALHKFDFFILRLFFMAIGYHLAVAFISALKGDWRASSRRLDAVSSRIKGFFSSAHQKQLR